MKYLKFIPATFMLYLCLLSCNQSQKAADQVDTVAKGITPQQSKDLEEIQKLIRKALNWGESNKTFDILPAIDKDSIYIGVDLEKHKANLQILKKTNLFSASFIENYNQIILTIDKKLRNKEYETWHDGELPTFGFANDVNPWCDCQDDPDEKSNPWTQVRVQIINLSSEKGDLSWKWGNLDESYGADWKDFSYKFSVEKENGKWKVSKMEGFDFKDATKKL